MEVQSFKQFVMNQPADREIDHDGGWSDCAVGDYAKHILGNAVGSGEMFNFLYEDSTPKEIIANAEVFKKLGDSEYSSKNLQTYGELQDLYKEIES